MIKKKNVINKVTGIFLFRRVSVGVPYYPKSPSSVAKAAGSGGASGGTPYCTSTSTVNFCISTVHAKKSAPPPKHHTRSLTRLRTTWPGAKSCGLPRRCSLHHALTSSFRLWRKSKRKVELLPAVYWVVSRRDATDTPSRQRQSWRSGSVKAMSHHRYNKLI